MPKLHTAFPFPPSCPEHASLNRNHQGSFAHRLLLLATVYSLLLAASVPARAEIIEETGVLKEFLMGTEPGCAYDNAVSHFIEGIARANYNRYNPLDPQTNGFGEFVPIAAGTAGDQLLANWKSLFSLMIRGDYAAAEAWRADNLQNYPYEIVHLTEPETNKEYYIVREQVDWSYIDLNNAAIPEDDEMGAFNHGWGLYVYTVNPEKARVTIQIVHPNDDYITPATGYDLFETLNAGQMFFSTVGREVLWTNSGTYDNTKSLCDPSRNGRTVYQMAHQAFFDYYVDEIGAQPFTMQMHSYDTGTRNFPSAIVSPSRYDGIFTLPLYDWSGMVGGMIDRTPWTVHPAGVIGNPNPITLTQFYGSSSTRRLEVYDDLGVLQYIPNPFDLYGHPENQQFIYRSEHTDACSDDEWTLHVEQDELPNSIDDDTTEVEFYGAPGFPITWQNFSTIVNYYHPMNQALLEAMDAMVEVRQDYAPSAPQDLRVTGVNDNHVSFAWSRSRYPFFETYRVYWDLNPALDYNSPYADRSYPGMEDACSQITEAITIDADLLYERQYYFAVAGVNRNGRVSSLSNVVASYTENTDPRWIWITEPNGGNVFFMDSTETIAWNPGLAGGTVKIEMSRFGMNGPWEVLTESTENDSLFSFLVSGFPSEACRIAISSVEDPSLNDTSDVNFAIQISQPILVDNFETIPSTWTHTAAAGRVDNWHLSTERAHSGTRSFKCGHTGTGTYAANCDSRLTHPAIQNLPENSRLRFYHQIQAELATDPHYSYDGGILEISVDGGAFTRVPPTGGYPNEVASNSGAPIAGQPCFADVPSWTSANVNLDAWAGHTIQVRWRFCSDATVHAEGWYIDDVVFYQALLETPGPSTVTAILEGEALVLHWAADQFVSYRVFSSSTPDGPFNTFEGETADTLFTVPGGASDAMKFFVVYGEHALPGE